MVQRESHAPLCLLMTGPEPAGRTHWLRRWAHLRDDSVLVDLGFADLPLRNVLLSRIDREVMAAGRPVLLVAHGLACHAVTWWAGLLGKAAARSVVGALLVAPPDPDRADADPRLRDFGPASVAMLPFPSITIAGRSDPRATVESVRAMAAEWASDFCVVSEKGSLDERSHLGPWPAGQQMLETVLTGGPGLSRYRYRRESPVRRKAAAEAALREVALRL
jgi:predicted alpha/beta hydrolase family esterase